jgi:uncharacterized membrane protein (UPF0127 family)
MIKNVTTGEVIATRTKWCTNFLTRGLGLMFHPPLREEEAYVFVESKESRSLTAIHMLFVFFPLAVLWLDSSKRVVDTALARPFYPYYAPSSPAQYYVECHPVTLQKVGPGHQLEF